MGTTPIKAMRYPDFGLQAMGPDHFDQAAWDLDAAFAAEDANRKAAAYRNRASIRNNAIAGSAAKTIWLTATFDTLLYDTAGMVNLGANNDRITIKSQGLYLVHFTWQIQIASSLGSTGSVITGVSKGISTTIPDPNFAAFQRTLQFDADVWAGTAWAAWQFNVNDFVTGRIWWNGTPAGPFTTQLAQLTVLQLNSS